MWSITPCSARRARQTRSAARHDGGVGLGLGIAFAWRRLRLRLGCLDLANELVEAFAIDEFVALAIHEPQRVTRIAPARHHDRSVRIFMLHNAPERAHSIDAYAASLPVLRLNEPTTQSVFDDEVDAAVRRATSPIGNLRATPTEVLREEALELLPRQLVEFRA